MDQARAIADAVLYEGYLLYPYRASAAKNKVRWQWGVLMPPTFAANDTGERSMAQSQLIAEPRSPVHLRLRFLQLQARCVEIEEGAGFRAVGSVVLDDVEYTTWDEAVEREVDVELDGDPADHQIPFTVDGGQELEPLSGGRVVRRRYPLQGAVVVRSKPLPGPFGGVQLTVQVKNTSPVTSSSWPDALRHAFIAAHVLLSLDEGQFLSQVDPPEWASLATKECVNDGMWPVLVGGSQSVLCSPIILYDQPEIAPESAGNLFDGTEIDEILTLRTMTLTDAEKREARSTDPRAAELIDRVDHLPAELVERLHGTIRYLHSVTPPENPAETPWWDPGADASVSPEADSVLVAGVAVSKGSRVRLRPGKRADAHDMFLAGRTAVVEAVFQDVDDTCHLAVTIEDDPGAELYAYHGRFRYFAPDEVEPL
ncbi:hypothetical protein [Kibdelosporangium philippinense]|nr:hypothetical protein [Kibdelosporangium philippinense]